MKTNNEAKTNEVRNLYRACKADRAYMVALFEDGDGTLTDKIREVPGALEAFRALGARI